MLASIVINNYNYGRYVGEAIDSALAQDHGETEIVVVDDGSTDDSRDVIRRYGDKVIQVFQANGGQGAAYNAGFAASHGDIVLFLDADDRLYPSTVTEIVRHCRPGVSKVQFDLKMVDESGQPLGRSVLTINPDAKTFLPLLHKFLFYPSPPGSGNAYSRSCLAKRLPLSPEPWKINADSYLIFAAPLDGEIIHLDACLGDYRRHGGGATEKSPGDLMNYAKKEYRKMVIARDYVAGLLGSAAAASYALPPTGLKLTLAEAFLCHQEGVAFSERLRFIRKALRTAAGWKPWPLRKRWALPFWALLVCMLPSGIRDRFITKSLVHSGY